MTTSIKYVTEHDPVIISAYLGQTLPLQKKKGCIVICTQQEEQQKKIVKALRFWLKKYSKPHIISTAISKESAQYPNSIICCTQQQLQEQTYVTEIATLKEGQSTTPQQLQKELEEHGYTREQRARSTWTYSIHGDTIHIKTAASLLTVAINIDHIEYLERNQEKVQMTTFASKKKTQTLIKKADFLKNITNLYEIEEKSILTAQEHTIFTIETTKESLYSEEERKELQKQYDQYLNPKTGSSLPPKKDVAFLGSLAEEDYIVHVDHGVGIYKGTTTQVINEIEKEFFIIEFAQQDKIFVPSTYAGKLSKYIGAANPTLHRIGGAIWNKARQKVQHDTEKIAKELTEIYAKRDQAKGFKYKEDTEQMVQFEEEFPYQETRDQERAIQDIKQDMENTHPVDRLICGDVGFGKTEVAMRAAFKVIEDNKQVAILAPTTILAKQHTETFKKRFANHDVRIHHLSRFTPKEQEKQAIKEMKNGEADIVVGTHKLLSKDLEWKNLGMLIVDEEQRFGVKHKEFFKKKRSEVDIVTLSATPIPRTLHFSLSGLRDISVITTPPPTRKATKTIIKPHSNTVIKEAIEQEFNRKGQLYYLYNSVETIQGKKKELEDLLKEWGIDMNIGILHGQLDKKTMQQEVASFEAKKTDILLCSTIVQNGIDLPNVNTMIVDRATHFGLTQLYQLKGRVGRGDKQGYAYFLYNTKKVTEIAKERLYALKKASHLGAGFEIAMRDMELRGTGNLLGREQSGNINAVGINLYTHMLEQAIQRLQDPNYKNIALTDPVIELPINTTIPLSYIADKATRLHLYEQVTTSKNAEEMENVVNAMLEKYGILPKEIKNLIEYTYISNEASKARILNITAEKQYKKTTVTIEYADKITPEQLQHMLNISEHWNVNLKERTISISIQDLGDKWPKQLRKSITKPTEEVMSTMGKE